MRTTKKYPEKPERWAGDPDKVISYEFELNGKPVTPGTKFKVKGDRSTYTFVCLVHNIRLDVTWIEAMNECGFKSFRPERITSIVVPKRSYRKKNV